MEKLEDGFSFLPSFSSFITDEQNIQKIMLEVAERLKNNYPYFHPYYAGQMLKPPHPIARIAYMLAMWINPNNHALDGGRASSQMEKEAVHEIAKMFDWDIYLGHLCGGGTMANLEALWISGQISPEKKIVASNQAHYTHSRISSALGLKYESIPCDRIGRMDINFLKKSLEKGDIGTVVATIGTTATGAIDPLPEILELQKQFKFRIHVDSAYGGYFRIIDNLNEEALNAYDSLSKVDSIVVDPHKHGLQPYGCGCVLFHDPSVGKFYKHESPYTYFSSSELHLGEISLECSRAGASAVALWATQKLLPLVKNGEFAKSLTESRIAALRLFEKIKADNRFITAFPPELDIVIWAPNAQKASCASEISRFVFEESAKNNLHLALAELPIDFFDYTNAGMIRDQDTITCLRSVLMKPEHKEWIDNIWAILDKVMNIKK